MARPRERVCLEQGLKLDLVQLARGGFIRFGANVGRRRIQWQDGRGPYGRAVDAGFLRSAAGNRRPYDGCGAANRNSHLPEAAPLESTRRPAGALKCRRNILRMAVRTHNGRPGRGC